MEYARCQFLCTCVLCESDWGRFVFNKPRGEEGEFFVGGRIEGEQHRDVLKGEFVRGFGQIFPTTNLLVTEA